MWGDVRGWGRTFTHFDQDSLLRGSRLMKILPTSFFLSFLLWRYACEQDELIFYEDMGSSGFFSIF